MCAQSTHDCLPNCNSRDESSGPMEFNDSHVKCTSLHFVGNAKHMKEVSNSIGPNECHVTCQNWQFLQATIND